MAKKTCPNCGTSIDAGRTICPACRMVLKEQSSLKPYLLVAGIVVVVILVIAVLLMNPSSQSVTIPDTKITPPPTTSGSSSPSQPACTIVVSGSKVPPSTIRLQVMTSTCSAGDVTELKVSVNGVQKGIMGIGVGTSMTYPGTSGANNVIVVAKFANGAERVVFNNAAL
jgi:predicted nucleic acid-binding Zn ribbon protein